MAITKGKLIMITLSVVLFGLFAVLVVFLRQPFKGGGPYGPGCDAELYDYCDYGDNCWQQCFSRRRTQCGGATTGNDHFDYGSGCKKYCYGRRRASCPCEPGMGDNQDQDQGGAGGCGALSTHEDSEIGEGACDEEAQEEFMRDPRRDVAEDCDDISSLGRVSPIIVGIGMISCMMCCTGCTLNVRAKNKKKADLMQAEKDAAFKQSQPVGLAGGSLEPALEPGEERAKANWGEDVTNPLNKGERE